MNKDTKDYWNDLYKKNDIGWDVGKASSPLAAYIDQLTNKDVKILIPGCGNGYEAEYLLKSGFTDITLIDIAPALTEQLKERFKNNEDHIHIITGDFFEHTGEYDLILEQTFLSALDPSLREAYANQLNNLLKPGGKVAGVLFSKHFDDNPPHGGSIEEYKNLFGEKFIINVLEPCYNSIKRRQGSEVFINLSKK